MSKKNIKIFKDKGYCEVKSAISKELADHVTQYALFDEMQDFTPDGSQVPSAHSKYADPAMESILLSLHSLMEENTGLKLYPTYSFYRVYRPGDVLVPHTDRESCEISATLCFNYNYPDVKNYQWPIIIDGTKINQKPGDLAIYRGIDLEHSREMFNLANENTWHIQGFFHYVDANGPYADFKWDKRLSIGLNKEFMEKNNLNNQPTENKSYITYL